MCVFIFSSIILSILSTSSIFAQIPNVCNSLKNYYSMDPKNCWHNSEFLMTPPQLILKYRYPLEIYETCTDDGYYLTMFRLPQKHITRRGIVYLQHPMAANSLVFVDKGLNASLAFLLYDQGYEIWIGNFRGTEFARKHKHLDARSREYWDYSFHEVGVYDIPCQIDLIVKVAKAKPQEISFVGISMSSTAGLVYATLMPEHSSKWLNVMILMAPTAYQSYKLSWLDALAKQVYNLEKVLTDLKIVELGGRNKFIYNLLSVCRTAPFMMICLTIEMAFFGVVPDEISAEWVPVMYAHNPDSLSVKTGLHYGQCAYHGRFMNFDYGREKNLNVYNSEFPPDYPVHDIDVPIYLMTAENDTLNLYQNVVDLFHKMPEKAKIHGFRVVPNFGHANFAYSRNLVTKVQIPVINLINKIRKPVK